MAVSLACLVACSQQQQTNSIGSADQSKGATNPNGLDNGTGAWRIHVDRSKVDGRETDTLMLPSEDDDGTTLILRCSGRKLETYIAAHSIIDDGRVRIRVGEGRPSLETWAKAEDEEGLFSPDPASLILAMEHNRQVAIEYRPFGHVPESKAFSPVGLVQALTGAPVCTKALDFVERYRMASAEAALKAAEADRLAELKEQKYAAVYNDPIKMSTCRELSGKHVSASQVPDYCEGLMRHHGWTLPITDK